MYELSPLCRIGEGIPRHANPWVKYSCVLELSIGCQPISIKCCSSITTIACGTWRKCNRCSVLNGTKKYFTVVLSAKLLSYYSSTVKIQSAFYHHRINIWFRFWLQYYYDAWDFEKIQSDLTLAEKLYIFSLLATVLLWCVGLEKKINVFFDILNWRYIRQWWTESLSYLWYIFICNKRIF